MKPVLMPKGELASRLWYYVRRTFGLYLSPDEIIEHLYSRVLDDRGRREWGSLTSQELAFMHLTTGMWIRNTYGLWDEQNPYTELNAAPNAEGVIDDPGHPDQVSMMIMEKLTERCRTLRVVPS